MSGADCAKIRWLPDYAVGVDQIDQEHRRLFDLASRLDHTIRSEPKADELQRVLKELLVFADDHFTHEEQLMVRIAYPYYREHCAQHQEIRQKLQTRIVEGEQNEYACALNLLEVLVEWLKCHTTTTDRRMGVYMERHGYAGVIE